MISARTYFLAGIFSIVCTSLPAQFTEFNIYPNGLMYSEQTMRQLGHIVDSLNVKFRTCELTKTHLARQQGKGHYIYMSKGNVKKAREAIENNISFEDFVHRFIRAKVEMNVLVTKRVYHDYRGETIVEFGSILTGVFSEDKLVINEQEYKEGATRPWRWVFNYEEGGEYTTDYLEAFYFTTELASKKIPEHYARMVQYAECMVDTSTQIFQDKSSQLRTWIDREEASKSGVSVKIQSFLKYAQRPPRIEKWPEDPQQVEKHIAQILHKDSLWAFKVRDSLSLEPEFKRLLKEATEEALRQGGSNDEFEYFVWYYYSQKAALQLKRNRVVFGNCSMDNSPRIHALNIALLSAQTVNWEIFLRAHLDIMNDNFQRASDGSYAWGRRETYIKELEELDINVADLLLGIALRIANPSENHYYGSISRLGRALSESKNASNIETKILHMIKDSGLDDYNRILMYWLFRNYAHYTENEIEKEKQMDRLAEAVQELPTYIQNRLDHE